MFKKLLFTTLATLMLIPQAFTSEYFEKAVSAYQKKQIEDAYIYLKNALQEDDENLPVKVLMGKVLLDKGLYSEGIQEFDESILLGADPNQFIFEQIRAMLLLGRYQALIDLLNSVELTLNKSILTKSLLIKSNAYLAMKKEQDALSSLLNAKKLAPNNISVVSSLAHYYIGQRHFKKAKNELDNLLTKDANNGKIWNLYADFYTAQEQHEKALSSLEKAYAISPQDPIIMRGLAHKYTNLQRHDDAFRIVELIIEKTPNDPYARLLKSQLLTQNNQLDEAQQLLQDISSKLSLLTDEQKNNDTSLAYVSGAAAFMQGNLELAQKELAFYVNDNPSDLAGLNMLTSIYAQQGQLDKIQELLEKNEKIILKNLNLSLKLFNVYIQTGKTYKAKHILENLENTYPNNLSITVAKANYFAKNKRFSEAIALLNEKKPAHANADYVLNTGLIYMKMGELEKAHSIADELLNTAPQNNHFKNFKGVIYLKEKQWQKAAVLFEQINQTSPQTYTSSFNLANAHAMLGKYQDALNLITPLASKNVNKIELFILKAKLLRDTQQLPQAIKTIEHILTIDNDNINAINLLMTLYYQQKNYDVALTLVDTLSKLVFLEPKHLIYKANILIQQERFDEARNTLSVLLGLAKKPDEFYQLSLLQSKAFDNENAYKAIEQALHKVPDNQLYLLTQAKLALKIKPDNDSLRLINTLNTKFPNNPNVALLQGDLWLKQQKFKKAQKAYHKALSLDDKFNQAIAKLYFLANKNIGKTLFANQLEQLLAKNKSTLIARNLLADFYLNTGQFKKAKVHYEILSIQNIKNKANIFNNLANIYLDENLDKAKILIKQAMALKPNNSAFIDTFGWIIAKQGDYALALKNLRKAYALNANNPSINYHIGYTLNQLGRKEEARIELEKAINSNVTFTEKQEATALLAALSHI